MAGFQPCDSDTGLRNGGRASDSRWLAAAPQQHYNQRDQQSARNLFLRIMINDSYAPPVSEQALGSTVPSGGNVLCEGTLAVRAAAGAEVGELQACNWRIRIGGPEVSRWGAKDAIATAGGRMRIWLLVYPIPVTSSTRLSVPGTPSSSSTSSASPASTPLSPHHHHHHLARTRVHVVLLRHQHVLGLDVAAH